MADMMILTPYIESRLPAQAVKNDKGDNMLHIPFTHHAQITDTNNITILWGRIKSIKTNKTLWSGVMNILKRDDNTFEATTPPDPNNTPFNLLSVGQFYKIQLAYTQDGPYSTTGTFKYVGTDWGGASGMSGTIMRMSTKGTEVRGLYYTPQNDPTEYETEYRFILQELQNGKYVAIEDSDWQLHYYDTDGENWDEWRFNTILKTNMEYRHYTVKYSIRTVNGYEKSYGYDATVIVRPYQGLDYDFGALLYAKNCSDDGYIKIGITRRDGGNLERAVGCYSLLRASSEDDYAQWIDIRNLTITREDIGFLADPRNTDIELWHDMTVKAGVSYLYALQPLTLNSLDFNGRGKSYYNSTIITNYEGPVVADFEDIFISDANYAIKLRFNPKVSSFKETHLESKVDTIGGQYPVIFRNGYTNYKEMPISGLLSIQNDLDINYLFKYRKPVEREEQREFTASIARGHAETDNAINLTIKNYANERDYKLRVLSWLNNGQPKLFRSPAEGNYMIRIINASLTPIDTLGRMLHTLNCTAYEIDKNDYNTLAEYGLNVENNLVGYDYSVLENCSSYTSAIEGEELKVYGWSSVIDYNLNWLPPVENHQCVSVEAIRVKPHSITTLYWDEVHKCYGNMPQSDTWPVGLYKCIKDGVVVYSVGNPDVPGNRLSTKTPDYSYQINENKYYNVGLRKVPGNKEYYEILNNDPHIPIYNIRVGNGLSVQILYKVQTIHDLEVSEV